MAIAQPVAGELIATLPLPNGQGVIGVRAERGGDRNFIEYRDARYTWQALIPPWAGRDGGTAIAFNDKAIMVRVLRNGVEQIFSFARPQDSRLGTISLGPSTAAMKAAAQKLGGRVWAYQDIAYHLVPSGPDGVALSAFDMRTGKAFWKTDVPPALLARRPSATVAGLILSDGTRDVILAAADGTRL